MKTLSPHLWSVAFKIVQFPNILLKSANLILCKQVNPQNCMKGHMLKGQAEGRQLGSAGCLVLPPEQLMDA